MRFVPRLFADPAKSFAMAILLCVPMFSAGGCGIASLAAGGLNNDVDAAYSGLHDQKVGIMVWAGQGITIDHPELQADVAKGVQEKLRIAGTDEVKGIKWVTADEILHFQEDHPELATQPAVSLATHFPLTRMVYIEIASLSLHPNDAVDLNRGDVTVSVKVIEVANGVGKEVYGENNINVIYPTHSPPEGVMGLVEDEVYHHTIDELTTEIAERFISHPSDDPGVR